ncbi:MAG TPA: hypothetical protein VKM72_06130 [Thermoanaerobaculia bacterium]|nr:hypothetical protein [Thermoanaerobaculia bacterium]
MPAEAQRSADDRQIEQQEESDDGDQHADRPRPLAAEIELASEVEKRAEKQSLHHDSEPRHEQRQHDRSRREEAARGEQAQQLAPRPRRRLGESGGELG